MLFYTVGQARVFVFMLAAGALCGLWHGLFYLASKLFRAGFYLQALLDLFSSLGIGLIVTASLILSCEGEIRAYALIAALLGFILYRNTVARLFWLLARKGRPLVFTIARAAVRCRALQKIFR